LIDWPILDNMCCPIKRGYQCMFSGGRLAFQTTKPVK
jgi:hypothetical protein